jgi:hypothetical protein
MGETARYGLAWAGSGAPSSKRGAFELYDEANMKRDITVTDLQKMAEHAGLKLPHDELQRLLPGVNRSKKQAEELRALIALEREPAATFKAPQRT